MAYRSAFRYWLVLTLLLVTGLGCSQGASKGKQGQGGGQRGGGARTNISVQTATVQRIAVQRQVDLSGTLISPDQARVSSEVGGIVRDVLVEIGQEVAAGQRSEEHTSELQSQSNIVCRLLLDKKDRSIT